MRINYTGKLSGLTGTQEEKLQLRFAKLSKLLDSPEEQRQAHVIVKTERRLTKAEITLRYYGHEVVGLASHTEPYLAMTEAAHRLETQILKLRKKWVDTKRHGQSVSKVASPEPVAEAPAKKVGRARPARARIYRPRVAEAAKPMSTEEAVAAMGKRDNYMLFRDPDGQNPTLLVRRQDGNFDLIET